MDAAPHRPLGAIVREWIALLDLPTTPVLRRRLLVGGVGLGALVALWPVIVRGGRVPTLRDLVIWLLGLLAVGTVLAVANWLGGVRFSRPRFADLALVALPMLVAALLTFPNLADPYFSAIGDEYAFWEFARELAKGLPRDPFSQAGVYGNHPVLSSYLMAATIKLFGPDQAGWRAAAALSLVVAAGGMALLGALAQGRVAGLVAGTGVAVAHPLLAYAHTGYNNIQAVPLTILSLAAGLAGRRVGSAALAFVGGVFAGFGWYTFYTGRVAIAALLALVVLQPGRGRRWLQALTAMFGFVLAILPLIASSKEEVITKMLAETAAAPAAGTDGIEAVLRRIVTMTVIAIRAPWDGDRTSHYISGPLLDPLSGAIVLAGLLVGVLLFWRAPWRWLWVWYGLALLAGGATSQYDQLPNSRSFFFLPPLLLFGGLAVGLLWRAAARWRPAATALGLAGAVAAMTAIVLNFQRLNVETPAKLHQIPEAVAAMASERNHCREALAGPLFLADGPEPVFEKLVDAYGWSGRVEIKKAPVRLGAREMALERCIIAFGTTGAAITELQRAAGEAGRADSLVWATDGAGNRRALLLRWKPNEPGRPPVAPSAPAAVAPTAYPAPPSPAPTGVGYPIPTTAPPPPVSYPTPR